MAGPAAVVESYLTSSESFEWERVRPDFYYVRIRAPGLYLGWLPVELAIGQRTVKVTGGFSVKPRVNEAKAYRYLLRLNSQASGLSFAIDAEDRIVLTARIPIEELEPSRLDVAFGRLVEMTESAVGSYLSIGFDRGGRPAGD